MKVCHLFYLSILLMFSIGLQAEEVSDSMASNNSNALVSQENQYQSSYRALSIQPRTRVALVVGNGDYRSAPLKNPVNDARDFAAILKKLGFDVMLKTNITLQELDYSIDQFGRQLEKTKGVGLFFYAGHGVQSRGKNYLIPISADLDRETDLKYQSFDAQRVIDEMEYAQNRLNIVILDACRDNPLTRSFRGSKKGLAKFDNTPSGLMLAYSTAPGKQAADGHGRNSPYTTELIKAVQKEGLPLEMVFKEVIKNVKSTTRGKQVPWVSSSVDGDFYFSESVASVTNNPTNTQNIKYTGNTVTSESKIELMFWETVNTNPSKEKYRAYLKKYPNGHFVSIAEYEVNKNDNSLQSNLKNEKRNTQPYNTMSSANQIEICDDHLLNKRLTTGKQGNAFSCYKRMLDADSDNEAALSGIKKIENIYLMWAKNAVKKGENKKANNYVSKLKMVNSENEEISNLEQEIKLASLDEQANSPFSKGMAHERSLGSERKPSAVSMKNSPVLSTISQNFSEAIRERDVTLAEVLLEQMRTIIPGSRKFENFEYEYRQLVLQMENEKLYETLIKEALEVKDTKKAEHYLSKIAALTQNGEVYLELKKSYETLIEESKKVTIMLTATVDDNMILVNGVEKGSTPLNLSLKKGDYLVELKKHGYPSHRLKLALYGSSTHHFELVGGFATGIPLNEPPLGIQMMAIEPGCFEMGSQSSEAKRGFDEKPHQVCIKDGFWMGKYEITQQQWHSIMKKNPSKFKECGSDCPVENVEWSEIKTFLKHLNNQTQKKYRLPTEAEWEYVARAGTNTPFSTGDCLDLQSANFNARYQYNNCPTSKGGSLKSTIKVGSYPANAWGVHDMHGNVSEWTCSEYNSHYDGTEQKCYSTHKYGVTGTISDTQEISIRGGSWKYKSALARSAYRDKKFANANNNRMGFRVVREK
ncbi:MAG: SUMF1/EgtB/PvdO family nonheme iron enzyme [Gammaproteobacteria bacterium]|nr:SUMF1/EgtB/PvdO family nonheme iron enzyme [Gammaproteobacteria bacterium]